VMPSVGSLQACSSDDRRNTYHDSSVTLYQRRSGPGRSDFLRKRTMHKPFLRSISQYASPDLKTTPQTRCHQVRAGVSAVPFQSIALTSTVGPRSGQDRCTSLLYLCTVLCIVRTLVATQLRTDEHSNGVTLCQWHCHRLLGAPEQLACHSRNNGASRTHALSHCGTLLQL
jgi:hypothetical protein